MLVGVERNLLACKSRKECENGLKKEEGEAQVTVIYFLLMQNKAEAVT